MTYKDTEILIKKYLNGETTAEEERQLALAVTREDAPDDWKVIAGMLGELTVDEALFDQLMAERRRRPRFIKLWPWVAAACVAALLIVFLALPGEDASTLPQIAKVSTVQKQVSPEVKEVEAKNVEPKMERPQPQKRQSSCTPRLANDNKHDVAIQATEDSSSYQDPARVNEFIAKLADYNDVEAVSLDCTSGNDDSTVVSKAYVFEDTQELDLFGRLLQVAYSYDNESPGYLLNSTDQQLYFTLKDMRRGKKYLWIVERIHGGRILLQCTRSAIDVIPSTACHQDYRNKLTLPGIHSQQNI